MLARFNTTILMIALLGVAVTSLGQVAAQDVEQRLEIAPVIAMTPQDSPRLMPSATELQEGNAVVIMLRMIWEQQNYVQTVVPKFYELTELPYDDPRIAEEIFFDGFKEKLDRAAVMRDAEWNYPLHEKPLAGLLLPDIQGLRQFAGRGLTLWIGTKIAKEEYDQALSGLRTQLGCAKHIAQTPILINQLVANAIAEESLEKVQLIGTRPNSPNLYWALAALPQQLGDTQSVVQWETEMVPRSLPSLTEPAPELDDTAAWQQIAAEFSDLMLQLLSEPMSIPEGNALQTRLLAEAKRYFLANQLLTGRQLNELSGEAVVMHWLLTLNHYFGRRIETAYQLVPPQAIEELSEISQQIADIESRVKAPQSSLPRHTLANYVSLQRFNRRVRFLQAVEAIRDHLARTGELPVSLSDTTLTVPFDPLTMKPFEYELKDGAARLAMAELPHVEDEKEYRQVLNIVLGE